MTLYEYAAAIDGWNRSQGAEEKPEPPSPSEFYSMVERLH